MNALKFILRSTLRHYLTPALFLACASVSAQRMSREQAVQTALQNNQLIKSAEYQIEYYKQLKKTGTDVGKLSAMWMHGQYNSIYQDNNFTLTQTIPFPTALGSQVRLGKEQVIGSQKNLVATQNTLVFDVKSAYEQLLYQEALKKLLGTQDSLYTDFAKASSLRYKTGESNLLEKTTAETQLLEVRNLTRQNDADIQISQTRIQALLKSDSPVIASDLLTRLSPPDEGSTFKNNPQLDFLRQQVNVSTQMKRVERNRMLPDIMVGYFNQSLIGVQNINGTDQFFDASKHFQGFELGLAIPIWFSPQLARSKAAAFQEEATRKHAEYFETTLTGSYIQALQEFDKNQASLAYYENSALQNADLILTQARKAYRGGEIGYIEYLQSLRSALTIKSNHLIALNQYNQSIIKLEFLIGKF
jgi:cobalt-zinc-cadmium resistance protein CzcA